ncbi:hypothetical protein K8I28_05585 [bacterium]|nr:hypothetical protein [bacterium]
MKNNTRVNVTMRLIRIYGTLILLISMATLSSAQFFSLDYNYLHKSEWANSEILNSKSNMNGGFTFTDDVSIRYLGSNNWDDPELRFLGGGFDVNFGERSVENTPNYVPPSQDNLQSFSSLMLTPMISVGFAKLISSNLLFFNSYNFGVGLLQQTAEYKASQESVYSYDFAFEGSIGIRIFKHEKIGSIVSFTSPAIGFFSDCQLKMLAETFDYNYVYFQPELKWKNTYLIKIKSGIDFWLSNSLGFRLYYSYTAYNDTYYYGVGIGIASCLSPYLVR